MNIVVVGGWARKQLAKLPVRILDKLEAWARLVELKGLPHARTIPGYHDEPLHGDRRGQRSIRLNKAYRAVYTTREQSEVEIVTVEEVNKHAY